MTKEKDGEESKQIAQGHVNDATQLLKAAVTRF